jgi:hypothetical protein
VFSVTSYALRVLLLSVVPGLGSSPARPQLRGFVGHRLEIPAALLALTWLPPAAKIVIIMHPYVLSMENQ